MPDWIHYVRQNLALDDLPYARQMRVVEEVALQLEDIYRDATSSNGAGKADRSWVSRE